MKLERSQTTRGRQCVLAAGAIAFGIVPTLIGTHARADIASLQAPPHPGGFWKCPPRGTAKGAFDNEDPVWLAAQVHVATDCTLHWSDGHGATYCFATPPSLLLLKEDPDILVKARAFWAKSLTRK